MQTSKNILHPEAGFMMVESLGSLVWYLIMAAGAGVLLTILLSGSKLSEMQQGLSSMRMQTQQLYTGSIDYSGLDNVLAVKSGIIPKRFKRGDSLFTPWGGTITIATGSDVGTFTIKLEEVPLEDCAKMGTFQSDSWVNVSINGNILDKLSTVATAGGACSTMNTIIYTSR